MMFDFFRQDDRNIINENEMDNLIGKVELIDIREPYEYISGSLRTAKNIPMNNLLSNHQTSLLKLT